jgi:transcriptional regulator with GAF, ATPase, and Fis domain
MDLQSLKQRFGIIGNSAALENALNVAVRVAPTDLSVLIMGESGVGKEVFSQIIHALSSRKHNSFIAVNCGAIPEGTIDSELFGHEKGAFTGASDTRKGYFEVVDGGTIFLDEIGEMPLGTQARLLRVLESGEFIRVGASKTLKTNVRIIAATNVQLSDAVRQGKFREDLYYRLNTVPIHIPPLRQRKDDIYLLFRKFSGDFCEKNRIAPITLLPDAREILLNYDYPGNIRELKNIAEQVSILSIDRQLSGNDLLRFIPQAAQNRQLPILASNNTDSNKGEFGNYSERDLLYRFLMDMRQDIAEMKQIMVQILGVNPAVFSSNATNYPAKANPFATNTNNDLAIQSNPTINPYENPNLLIKPHNAIYNAHLHNHKAINDDYATEFVEDSLSIEDKERELIVRALSKHKNRRKDAAADLGISERTLYRKIREYNIKE